MQSTAIPPVRKSIEVATTPERAFRIFTGDMGRWWPTCGEEARHRAAIVLEPRVDGRWFERTHAGEEHDWGRVLAWDPPRSLVLAWQVNREQQFDPNLRTEVEIGFVAVATGRTRVSVEHRKLEQFGVRAEEARAIFDGPKAWVGVLEALRAAADATG